MNPYQFPVTCDVCGGEGVGTIQTAGAAWLADSQIRHRDPRVCAENLRQQRKELERIGIRNSKVVPVVVEPNTKETNES